MSTTGNHVIIAGYVPGAIGRVVQLHAEYYHRHWGFGRFFEVKVAEGLSEFWSRFDERRDGFWTACLGGQVEGSIAIDGIHADSEGAHLRWFILAPELHGRGLGNRLLETAINFCHHCGYHRVYLWTFQGLDAARHLYEKFGFSLATEKRGTTWGVEVNEQEFVLGRL